VDHHLIPLPRSTGVELVVQGRLGQQRQRVGLLRPGRRFQGWGGGRRAGLGGAAPLVQRLAGRVERPPEQRASTGPGRADSSTLSGQEHSASAVPSARQSTPRSAGYHKSPPRSADATTELMRPCYPSATRDARAFGRMCDPTSRSRCPSSSRRSRRVAPPAPAL
jgi:hypothetical protein